jgi:Papain family cysteine protease
MKKSIVYFSIFLGATFATAQTTGLILDEAEYAKVPKLADFEVFGSKLDEIPTEYDLKKYCPEPNNQGSVLSCVFQSLAYGAMTIQYAAQNNITDKAKITKNAFSVLYGFNQVTTQCNAIPFKPALELLKTKGTPLFSSFDQSDKNNCRKKPTQTDHAQANAYRIKHYSKLFNNTLEVHQKIAAIKKSIAADLPVIVGMWLPERFEQYKGDSEYFESGGDADIAHAMVVVGYDEYSFELMNSRGKYWGKNGYVKIKYSTFFQYCREAYQIAFEKRADEEPVAPVSLQGNFEFRTPRNGTMQPVSFALKAGKYYEATEKCVLDQQFQLAALNLQKNKYVYVFSHDPEGKVSLHWPKSNGKIEEQPLRESPLTPYETTSFLIPGAKRAFTVTKTGTDFLFVLYSDKELDMNDLYRRLKLMGTPDTKPVLQKFESAFAGLLLDWTKIKYDATKVTFSAPTTDAIVPLIIKIESE